MSYLLVPLDDAIVFPSVSANLQIDVGDEDQVFLLTRRDGEFERVGVVAEVIEHGHGPQGEPIATVVGLRRGLAGVAQSDENDPEALRIEVQEIHDGQPDDEHTKELAREYRAIVEEILELRGADGRIAAFLRSVEEPGALADTAGLSPDVSVDQKVRLLDTINVTARLELAVELQRERLAELQVRSRIRDDVESGAQAQQREYFLRKQMDSIRKELGDDEASLIEEYEKKIADAGMPEAVAGAGREGTAPPRTPGRAVGRELDDPQLPRLADQRAVVRDAPKASSIRSTPARSSMRTTPVSTTSRSASPSSSPSASSAPSAVWRRTAAPTARS